MINHTQCSVSIPPSVRFCTYLSYGSIIFLGELLLLTGGNGSCALPNTYFAEIFKVHPQTIQNWINCLEKHNFITVKLLGDTKSVDRIIVVSCDEINERGE